MVAKRIALALVPVMLFFTLGFAAVAPAHAADPVDLTVTTWGEGQINIDGNGWLYWGSTQVNRHDSVYLEAQGQSGSVFEGWYDTDTGACVSTESGFNFLMDDDYNLEARFEYRYVLACDVDPAGTGYVYCGAASDAWVGTIDTSLPDGYYEISASPNVDYMFEGYYDQWGNFCTDNYTYGVVLNSDTYLTAKFVPVPAQIYNLSIVASDWSGGWTSASTYSGEAGTTVTIEAQAAPGYTFRGWGTTDGWPFSPDAEYTFDLYQDLDLIAYFEPEDAMYTVYIEPNGGSGYMPDPSIKSGEVYTLPECEFTPPAGKVFDTWDVGAPGTTITINDNLTIAAQWVDSPTYTVHVEPNGGTGYMPDPEIAPGDSYTLPECDFTAPAGKKFTKWDVGEPGEAITINDETWIYAQWEDEAVKHLVYIDPNGGSGYMPDPYVEHGTSYTLPECDFTAPEGKQFDGWDVGKPGASIKVEADMSIYAQWKDIEAPAPTPAPTPDPTPAPTPTPSPDPSSSSSASPSSGSAASSGAASSASASASSASASLASASSSASSTSSSASASSTSASSASGSGSGTASSASGSGSGAATGSGSGSGTGGNDMNVLPIVGGVVGGGLLAALVGFFLTRRKKDEGDEAAQPTEPIAQPTEPIAPHEEEGYED